MIRRILAHLINDILGPAPADLGLPEPEQASTVRECRADEPLTTEQWAEIESMTWDREFERPHEGTAAERIGGAR